MKTLPTSVSHYKSTQEFDENTVPMGPQRDHTTAAGVWATINVIEGQLDYCITEPSAEKHNLTPSIRVVIEPQMKHFVKLSGPVKFRVDFYR